MLPDILANAKAVMSGQPLVTASEANPITEWEGMRRGKFTASRIADLCTKSRNGQEMGKTAMSYIYEVLGEQLGDIEDNYVSKEMQYGIDNEPVAAQLIAEKYPDFQYLGTTFFPHPEFGHISGASPDGMIGTDTVVEIKTLYTTRKYLECLSFERSKDVLSAAKDYYYQVQMQIACTGAKEGLLMFFNPRFLGTFNEHRAIHPILIPRDEEVIEDIRISIMGGIAHLNFLKRRFALTK